MSKLGVVALLLSFGCSEEKSEKSPVPQQVDPTVSKFSVDRGRIVADGVDAIYATIKVSDTQGMPISGCSVGVGATNRATVGPFAPTDADGVSKDAITSTFPGPSKLRAGANCDGTEVSIGNELLVIFDPPAR